MNIILLGPPGAGKGTQARAIVDRYDLEWISTGDVLRDIISSGDPLSRLIRPIMDKGGLIPDQIIIEVLAAKIGDRIDDRGFLLDGFPRTVAQADKLDVMLRKNTVMVNAAIHITIDDALIIERISGRLHCAGCGSGYHLSFQPPKRADICDQCGGRLERRRDDTPKAVRHRLKMYHEKSAPLLPYYRKRGILYDIEGTGSVDAVGDRVDRAIAPLICQIKEKKAARL